MSNNIFILIFIFLENIDGSKGERGDYGDRGKFEFPLLKIMGESNVLLNLLNVIFR